MSLGDVSKEAIASGGVAAVFGMPLLIWFYKRIFAKAALEDTSKTATDAQCSVIEMLRSEVRRMSDINGELAKALNELQLENVELRKEISALHDTINEMTERLNIISRRKDDKPDDKHSWGRGN